jgi:hypothetical protein
MELIEKTTQLNNEMISYKVWKQKGETANNGYTEIQNQIEYHHKNIINLLDQIRVEMK